MNRENHNEAPTKYKMNEGKKREILTHLKQADNEVLHKKRNKIPLIPSLGVGFAALLIFILFASPIMDPLYDGESSQKDTTLSQMDQETTQVLEKMMTSKDVTISLFNENYKESEGLNQVTGMIDISVPSGLSNELKSLQSSFRVRVSNENISVMSDKYKGATIFNNESASGLLKFEINLTEEEATQLKEKNVDLSLYAYNDVEDTHTQPVAHSNLKTSKELEKLGERPDAIRDLFTSKKVQLNVKNLKLTKEGAQDKLTGMVSLTVPSSINADVKPSSLTYTVVLNGQESSSISKKYSGKSIFFRNQPEKAMIPFEVLFNGEDATHRIEGKAGLYLNIYKDENTPLWNSEESVRIKTLNLDNIYLDPLTSLRLAVVQEALETTDITIEDYVYMNSQTIIQNEKYKSLGILYVDLIKSQKKGDIKPYVYLDRSQTKGYIFEKKKNGKINIYQILLDKETDKWSISETIYAQK
ncbi:hypothetical protein [Pontibacillus marinus]|uniref:Uncharacterized protein n=1 Tax=Pontibacillus marinus BH030004 = DSM 16465 TaxID=1385511 RepID=A0A0A5GGB5_9BACI|nr:hypothetical protein [Pontibacillus marinus]KGX90155.1 hypothetical protein N783_01300 [Pontibacillus marinus BH030004 = DSM 16465]